MNTQSLKKIIISKGRSKLITTHKIINYDCVVLIESEYQKYLEGNDIPREKILVVKNRVVGLGVVRNYILDYFKENIVIFDDDIIEIKCLLDNRYLLITDKDKIDDIITNCWLNCVESGAKVFGFNQMSDVRKYNELLPFVFNKNIGCVIGMIDNKIRFDEVNKMRVDIDYCLKQLLVNRILWRDNRYVFCQNRFRGQGGNNIYKTKTNVKLEIDYLKNKWGKYIQPVKSKINIGITVNVER